MKRKTTLLLAALALMAAGCKKDNNPAITPVTPPAEGQAAYLLNEGSWGGNNAELSLINLEDGTVAADWFSAANGRGLGDVAQDLVAYGSRLYAAVYGSNTLEVIDAATGRSLKQLSLGSRGPRHLACWGGKVYVSCYDRSVARIDTATLAIEASCPLGGMQPEQLCAAGGKLYVCNSWQYDNSGGFEYDSTLSVVDLATFAETGRMVVGCNPSKVKVIDNRRIVVACAGDYGAHPAKTVVLDIESRAQQTLAVAATNLDTYGGNIYLYCQTYDSLYNPAAQFYRIDGATLAATPILQDYSSRLSSAYGISVNPANGDLYVTNSPYGTNADLYCFTSDGTLRWQAEGRNYASKVAFR